MSKPNAHKRDAQMRHFQHIEFFPDYRQNAHNDIFRKKHNLIRKKIYNLKKPMTSEDYRFFGYSIIKIIS